MTGSQERQALRERFGFRCGYCGIHESEVGAELTVDHFQPRSRGGSKRPDNRVYCCHACNEFKGDYWQPESLLRILHPERDALEGHLRLAGDGTLRALSETGVFHILHLRLNRPALVAHRSERLVLDAALAAQAALLERLDELEARIGQLEGEIAELHGGTAGDIEP